MNDAIIIRRKVTSTRLRLCGLTPMVWASGYIILSCLSGVIELGVLIMAVRGRAILEIPLYALAYQLGAVLSHPIRMPRSVYVLAGLCGCVCTLVGSGSTVAQSIAILSISTALQHGRELMAKRCHVTTFWKRTARVCGFLFAPWLGPWGMATMAVGIMAAVLLVGRAPRPARAGLVPSPLLNMLGLTMMVHQSHYFLYSCFLPFMFMRVHGIPQPLVGLAFSLGWTSYCCAPMLCQRWRAERVFVLGHVLVFVSLVVLLCGMTSPSLVLATWFITGFGGGTVFCLRDLERQCMRPQHAHLDAWENIGHVAGILGGIVITATCADVTVVFGVAAMVALCTAIMGMIAARRAAAGLLRLGPEETAAFALRVRNGLQPQYLQRAVMTQTTDKPQGVQELWNAPPSVASNDEHGQHEKAFHTQRRGS